MFLFSIFELNTQKIYVYFYVVDPKSNLQHFKDHPIIFDN